jgi:hypothetical protein
MAEDGFTVNNFDHLEEAQNSVSYGIYDTQDNCWIGDETGPRVFTREDSAKAKGMPHQVLAKIAAMMAEMQLGYKPGRFVAAEFNAENLRLRDSVETKMTPLEALIKLENGQ